jgi:hypothetical protein
LLAQDWDALSSSSDDYYYRRDADSDSGDSNCNGYHPGLDGPSRSRSFGPRTTRVPDAGDAPALGRGSVHAPPPARLVALRRKTPKALLRALCKRRVGRLI